MRSFTFNCKLWILPLLTLSLLFIAGCSDNQSEIVDKIKIISGEEQCAVSGADFKQEVKLRVLGPEDSGLLGGKGNRSPIANVKVHFIPVAGSDLIVSPSSAVSDAGGNVSVKVSAGKKTGDQYLDIIPEGFERKTQRMRFITGMEIKGDGREYHAASISTEPVGVKLIDSNGKPAAGIPVKFQFLSTAEGSKTTAVINRTTVMTNAHGVAETRVKLGKKTGSYQVGIEIMAPDKGFLVGSKSIKIFAFNIVGVIVSVLGGLTLFVFGMKLMSDGIQKIAGENMKKMLQFFARNGIVAVLAGTLVTAVIQSSSATTMMVIGFINAGLLSLEQSIGIIFGANIGTTVTAQIISFNLSGLALPAITIGFLITLSKKRVVSGWGETILGFGLLFFGMTMMSDELKALGEFGSFKAAFKYFDCTPVDGFMPIVAVLGAIGIGVVSTVMIQSSSATMGIVLVLAGSGLINFYTAVPLLVGTNIGTTITALLGAITANRVAKQAALAHLLFNVFGALVMLILFYIPYGQEKCPIFLYFINKITPGDAFAAIPQNVERHIAMAHTLFNVVIVVILMPFIKQFAALCNWILPIPENKPVKITILEPSLLNTPSIALKQTTRAIKTMVEDSWQMIDAAVNRHFLVSNVNEAEFQELAKAEERIDKMQAEVTSYLVLLTRHQLTEPQSELIPLLMHCTNDAERIADHTEIILQLTERLTKTDRKISETGNEDLKKMWEVLDDQQKNVVAALGSDNPETVKFALKDQRKISTMAGKFESDHIDRLRRGDCMMTNGIIFIEMLGELEKIGAHLENIAERTSEIQKHYIKL